MARAPIRQDSVIDLPNLQTVMNQPLESSDNPKVSVVIVNFNGLHHLAPCLASLATSTGPAFETIVVDNGSTDGSVEWLTRNHPAVRVLAVGENLGFGAANRLGVESAKADYIAFLNNDTVVEADWLTVLIRVLDGHDDIAAACSLLKLLTHPEAINANGGAMTWIGNGFDRDFGQPSEAVLRQPSGGRFEHVLFPTAAAMVIRKRDFLARGGYDPSFFMYHEDVDLGWRLWLAARRVVLCRESVVYHHFGGTSQAHWGASFSARLGARHNLRSLIKNYDRRNVRRSLYRLNRTWIGERRFRFLMDAWAWNLRRLPDTLRERRRIQRSRLVSDDALIAAGLISYDRLYPPPQPSLPSPRRDLDRSRWLLMPVLLPGEDSALGRLGVGWYPAEPFEGGRFRRTCGMARAFLRVQPSARGVLRITVLLDQVLSVGEVRVECNGTAISAAVNGAGWQTLEMTTTADHEGILSVAIRTPGARVASRPGDRTLLGCAVRELAFEACGEIRSSAHETISVVIPTYNRWERLETTLAALADQTRVPTEVVVVDDGSTDDTWEHLNQLVGTGALPYPLRIVRQDNGGPASARNAGVREATGHLILFLGDDTTPDRECVEHHIHRHREIRMDCAIVGFTDWCRRSVRVTPFLEVVNSEGYQFGYGAMRDGQDVPFTCFYTSNLSLPRSLLIQEPFNTRFKHAAWEDTELGYRLALSGMRIIYARRAVTHHVHPLTVSTFLARMRSVGERSATIFELHPSLRQDPAILPPAYPVAEVARQDQWLRWFIPALDLLDRLRIRLPSHVYRVFLMSSFCKGIEQSRARSPVHRTPPPVGSLRIK
jgi:GT2 family glycosyltransferase